MDVTHCVDVSSNGSLIVAGCESSLVRCWRRKPRYSKSFQREVKMKIREKLSKHQQNSELVITASPIPQQNARLNKSTSRIENIDKTIDDVYV